MFIDKFSVRVQVKTSLSRLTLGNLRGIDFATALLFPLWL